MTNDTHGHALPGGWLANRWVSQKDAFHLWGPGGVECDVVPDDFSEAGVFLRALAQHLVAVSNCNGEPSS